MPIEYLQEYDRYVMIGGLRDAKILDSETVLQQLRSFSNEIATQILDVNGIAGRDHLCFAVLNALKGRVQCRQITESLAVEILLYASAQRQIKNAIAALGVSPNTKNVAVIAIASNKHVLERLENELASIVGGKLDESVLDEGDQATVRRIFSITDDQVRALLRRDVAEKEAVAKLVIEKMALLSSQI